MKKVYSSRRLIAFLTLLCCYSISLLAQTQPTPQTIPYTQDFSSLAANSIVYPAGFQGWSVSTATIPTPSNYVTTGTIVGDKSLTASSTAATTSGNIHNYNGKIGFLTTGSSDLSIGLALDTSGKTGIVIQYDAMVIRNPQDASNSRINEMSLQYRVGITDAFTTITSTAYTNGTTNQTTGVAPQNSITIKTLLPAACENQSVVQIRWISKQISGGGSRPSFAIDNISIQNDVTAPINIAGFPKIENTLSDGFDFSTQLDEIGKTYYVLLAGGSSKPSIAQIKAGLDADGNPALQADVIEITDASLAYTKTITGLNLNSNYTVYSISEDNYTNIQTDSNEFDFTTSSIPTPSIKTAISSLAFDLTEQNFDSNTLSYQVQATNLSSDVMITTTGNFTVSKEANANFQTSIKFDKTDFDANTPTVYVHFTPNNTGDFTGQITHESTGATTKIVVLSGTGINPYIQGFNDVNVLTNSGWTQYNVAGILNKWTSTTTARNVNSGTGAVLMNGYSDTGASQDWLISPKLHLDTFGQFPLLSFYTRKFYTGPSLKLMVSVDYDGKSNPETGTWTEIVASFPTETGTYVPSQFINLAGYKTSSTYLAWVYETTAGGTNFAAEWSLDDVAITNELGYIATIPNLDFGDVNVNTFSTSQSFSFKAEGYGDISLTAPSDYQISLDNSTFQSNVIVTAADAAAGKTIYARFTPSIKTLAISGTFTVTGTSLNKQIGLLTGSSLPKTETFDIVSYNLEFFGSDVKNISGVEFGPIDDALQVDNVAKVMNTLNADVYVVQEVSDDPSLDILIQKLNINGKTFDKTISPVWSYSFSTPDPNFPPQKLVVIYNTQTTTVKKTSVMFKDLYDNIQATTTTLPNYPGPSTSFFASGRLPYMVEIETNIAGVKKDLTIIDIHARANSGTDISKYNMRKYDVEYLKNELDTNYPDTNFMILGDYNDDVKTSVIAGQPSSYEAFVNDTARYDALTLGISNAGAYSFLSSGGFLDHIITSNELSDEYIPNSTAVYDPRNDITNYVNTTSDHGPVIARFELKSDVALSISQPDMNANFIVKTYPNPATNTVNLFIKTNSDKNLKLKLYDIHGRIIINSLEIKGASGENIFPLNISQLQSGIYFYTLSEYNKVVYRNKIIKK